VSVETLSKTPAPAEAASRHGIEDRDPGGILLAALREAAHSVHIDLSDEGASVQARIGGRLREIARISVEEGYALADALEDGLKGDHGVLSVHGGAVMLRFRLAACPSARGQRLVVTFIPQDEGSPASSLEALGAPPAIRAFLERQLAREQGMILVAGLQGSRRRRTIGAVGCEIQRGGGCVLMLHDEGSRPSLAAPFPVFSLDAGREMWRLLDQVEAMDADCVILPDVRSLYHVNVALAMSGPRRISLAPIRAQDSAGALVMLRDLGAARFRAARDLAGVIAQQRLPKPCPYCSQLHRLTEEEVPAHGWDPASRRALLGRGPLVRSRGHGCARCSGSGYAGWTTIYEVLEIDGGVAESIRTFDDPGRLREELKQMNTGSGLLDAAWREVLRGNADPMATGAVPGPDVAPFKLSPASLALRAVAEPAAETRRTSPGCTQVEALLDSGIQDSPAGELRRTILGAICSALERLDRGDPLDAAPLEEAAAQIVAACEDSHDLVNAALTPYEDGDLAGHSFDVAVLAVKIAAGLGWDTARKERLALTALLHDVGQLRLPPELVEKERLIPAEEEIWRRHAVWGEEMLRGALPGHGWLASLVRQVHERDSGAGFPDGLTASEIDEMAKVIGLSDHLKLLTSPRRGGPGLTTFDAIHHINKEETREFDRRIFRAMTRSISLFPVGSLVQLNNQSIARVAGVNAENFHRPEVVILIDQAGRRLLGGNKVNLADSPFLYITGPLRDQEVNRNAGSDR